MNRDEKRGRIITYLREGALLTRPELAEKAGTTAATIIDAESGKVTMRVKTAKKISAALDVDPVMLLRADERLMNEHVDE